jgi:deazaflavin-dependent oxidoreductase (nitroreductase family)
MTNAYQPSSSDRVREQVALILTTIGAETGNIRKNPVMRIKEGDTHVAVASNAGATSNPSWYRNLIAHPQVSLQDGATVYQVRAREVRGEEKTRWWLVAERDWPHFPEYRAKAGSREIPLMLLEPTQTYRGHTHLAEDGEG